MPGCRRNRLRRWTWRGPPGCSSGLPVLLVKVVCREVVVPNRKKADRDRSVFLTGPQADRLLQMDDVITFGVDREAAFNYCSGHRTARVVRFYRGERGELLNWAAAPADAVGRVLKTPPGAQGPHGPVDNDAA